jgi:hypothetical protein
VTPPWGPVLCFCSRVRALRRLRSLLPGRASARLTGMLASSSCDWPPAVVVLLAAEIPTWDLAPMLRFPD